MLCSVAALYGQSLSQQKEKRSRIERDIAILREQLSGNASQASEALSSITMLQAQQKSRQKLIKESDRELAGIDARIGVIRAEIRKKQEALDTLEAHYQRLVMGAYKNRDIKLWYMYILASDSITQALRRFGYFKGLSSQIQAQARKIEVAQEELNVRRRELLQVREAERKVKAAREKELASLKADEARQQKLVAKLKKDKKAYQASLRTKQAEMRAIDKQISAMLSQATSGSSTQKKSKPIDYTLDKNFENNKGKLPWPVDGPVTEHYGAYQNKELRLSLFNNGINIACESDSPVRCVFDGVVSNVMIAPGYGQCILIQHGTYYSSYCKVKNASVRQGDKVTTGQILGEVSTIMGKTQLYFLIYKKKYLDPEVWLRDR